MDYFNRSESISCMNMRKRIKWPIQWWFTIVLHNSAYDSTTTPNVAKAHLQRCLPDKSVKTRESWRALYYKICSFVSFQGKRCTKKIQCVRNTKGVDQITVSSASSVLAFLSMNEIFVGLDRLARVLDDYLPDILTRVLLVFLEDSLTLSFTLVLKPGRDTQSKILLN